MSPPISYENVYLDAGGAATASAPPGSLAGMSKKNRQRRRADAWYGKGARMLAELAAVGVRPGAGRWGAACTPLR